MTDFTDSIENTGNEELIVAKYSNESNRTLSQTGP